MKKILCLLIIISNLAFSQVRDNFSIQNALNLELCPQKNTLWCWAASFEMVFNYQNTKIKLSQEKILKNYIKIYNSKYPNKLQTDLSNCNNLCKNKPNCELNVNYESFAQNCNNHDFEDKPFLIKNIIHSAGFQYYIYRDTLKWDFIRKSINTFQPLIIDLKEEDRFKSKHLLVLTGYKEINNTKFVMIKDPWLPCKGCEYLLNFESLQKNIQFYIKILKPKKTRHSFVSNTYFQGTDLLINKITESNYLVSPLDTNKPVGSIPLIYRRFDNKLLQDSINKFIANPNKLIIYERSDTTKTAIINKINNNSWSIEKIFTFPKCHLLCCSNLDCNLNISITIKKDSTTTDSDGNRSTFTYASTTIINPKAIFEDSYLGFTYKYYQNNLLNNGTPILLPISQLKFTPNLSIESNSTEFNFNKILKESYDFNMKVEKKLLLQQPNLNQPQLKSLHNGFGG